MFMTHGKILVPWVLFIEQESYLLYINLNYKHLGFKTYTKSLKNHMRNVDTIIAGNQSAAIKNRTILHIFSTIWKVIHVLNKLNSNLALNLSLNFYEAFDWIDWNFMLFVSFFCHKFVLRKFILPSASLVNATNLITWLKFRKPISNLKLK